MLTVRMLSEPEFEDRSADQSVSHSAIGTVSVRERRDRLESGIILWARINAIILLAITVFTLLLEVAAFGTGGPPPIPWAQVVSFVWLAGFSLVLGRLRLDVSRLELADLVGTISTGFAFAMVVSFAIDLPAEARELVFELTMAHVLMIRAGVVPSSGRRTLWVGALAVAPGVLLCTWGLPKDAPTWAVILRMVVRCSATIFASALASRRIYGLQKQVAQARRLGQYTLQEKVGTGGMGVVFRATHALLRRPTAIKLLRPEEAGESTLNQFEREAQLTSQLTHPSTIQIYDFGRNESGVFYYAMEYLEGLTLHELVELTGPQPVGRVIALIVQACGSLAEAHGVGLVHRDIKPSNIMVCERGRLADVVKVLDFGLVKMRGQPSHTQEGGVETIAGTPGFMAPEAIVTPESVDARSDLYSVGAVAYYLITGEYLFGDRAAAEVLLDQVNTEPVPVAVRLGMHFPSDVDQVIKSCLAKDPLGRPQSADELSERLLACADARGWSQVQARAWWSSNRELVQERVRERSSSIKGVSRVLRPGQAHPGGAVQGSE